VIRRVGAAAVAGVVAVATGLAVRAAGSRAVDRLLVAPRTTPDDASLTPAVDELGGEVVRLRSRDGLRLGARWLPALAASGDDWALDAHEATILLHGYTGSVAPDLVEYGPFLRRTTNVLGLDFRGHGESDDGPTTFGLLEVEDVAGTLAWLGERGITRVALFGTSMGGIVALASVAVLGDGTLASADLAPDEPRHVDAAPRPGIVAVVAESVAPELVVPIASRLPGPAGRFAAARLFDGATSRLGADPRATEPGRIIGLVEPVPLLLIHGADDTTVPLADGERLAAMAGPSTEHWVVSGADHAGAHRADPEAYEQRVTTFLRTAVLAARNGQPILGTPGAPAGDRSNDAILVED
jgi:pimeloyl-ACP methyl ester carboxylesterase